MFLFICYFGCRPSSCHYSVSSTMRYRRISDVHKFASSKPVWLDSVSIPRDHSYLRPPCAALFLKDRALEGWASAESSQANLFGDWS